MTITVPDSIQESLLVCSNLLPVSVTSSHPVLSLSSLTFCIMDVRINLVIFNSVPITTYLIVFWVSILIILYSIPMGTPVIPMGTPVIYWYWYFSSSSILSLFYPISFDVIKSLPLLPSYQTLFLLIILSVGPVEVWVLNFPTSSLLSAVNFLTSFLSQESPLGPKESRSFTFYKSLLYILYFLKRRTQSLLCHGPNVDNTSLPSICIFLHDSIHS